MSQHRFLLSLILLAASGCEGGTPIDVLVSHGDPRVDDTAADAPFEPGQHRDVGDADLEFEPAVQNEYLTGVIMPGDLDGDGVDDLVAWAHEFAPPDLVECDDGCPGFQRLVLYIAYGGARFGAGGPMATDATLVGWYISSARSWVEPAGDLDGDGLADVLIGVTGDCQQGNVFTLFGGPRRSGTAEVRDLPAVLREREACSGFGLATGVGDLDADGFDDFVVAAPDADASYLFYGSATRPAARRSEVDADATLVTALPDGIGPARAVGDVNGDGRADLLIANAPDDTASEAPGTWHLVLGGERLGGVVTIETISTRFQAALAQGLGDLDGDGRAEIGVTLNGSGVDGYAFAGREAFPATLEASDGVLRITRVAAGASTALLPAGDLDGDGHADFAYTDSRESGDEFPRGAVHIFLGPMSLTSELDIARSTAYLGQRWTADRGETVERGFDTLGEWTWHFGNGFAGGSDLDGDGHDDLALIGRGAPESGRLYIIRGRS